VRKREESPVKVSGPHLLSSLARKKVSANIDDSERSRIFTDMSPNLIVILGPTASGKTRLAVRLARDLGSEIISADSRQVYRGMDIGTGKDLEEYRIDGQEIPHHLINIVDPAEDFNVFEFQSRFYCCFAEISSRGLVPILVGGTGLYLSAVLEGYRMVEVPENQGLRESLQDESLEELQRRLLAMNPSLHNTTDLLDRSRVLRAIEIAEFYRKQEGNAQPVLPAISPMVIGVHWNRESLRKRIALRLKERLAIGMIDEVIELHRSGIPWDRLHFWGLEYRYVALYLQRKMSYSEMVQILTNRISQFAKRQGTWFRRMERHGVGISWIEGDDYQALKTLVDRNLPS